MIRTTAFLGSSLTRLPVFAEVREGPVGEGREKLITAIRKWIYWLAISLEKDGDFSQSEGLQSYH